MKTHNFFSVILILTLICGSTVWAQDTRTVEGKVTTFGVIPLNNVKITTTKSKQEIYTDYDGSFSIACVKRDMLKVFAAGFDPQRVKIKNLNSVAIDLVYSNNEASFYNATENEHITEEVLKDAMSKYPLKGEKDYSRYNNIYELIKTEIYNVNVNGTAITTRKPAALGQQEEVLNEDGITTSTRINPASITKGQEVKVFVNGVMTRDISYIVPADVKSIRYVDGPAASRYGLHGANGVIEITIR